MTEDQANTAAFLIMVATTLDRWAYESVRGGWSTHQVKANQVKANQELADDCRRQARSIMSDH